MLITLEGIDGSGKTTVWESLRDRYPSLTYTSEPTDSWYGDAVRQSLSDETADAVAELFLYTADHADHLSRVIRPALEAGAVVLADRYSDSRYAYQGAVLADRLDDPVSYIKSIHRPFTIAPDATIYFDLPPSLGAERSGASNKFEQTAFLEEVRDCYERLIEAEPDRFYRVDASQDEESVLNAVEQLLEEFIESEANRSR